MFLKLVSSGPCDCECHDNPFLKDDEPCCGYTHTSRAVALESAQIFSDTYGKDHGGNPPKYAVGQRVRVNSLVAHNFGIVAAVKRIFHVRVMDWVNGYEVSYDNNNPVIALPHVPEKYLENVN